MVIVSIRMRPLPTKRKELLQTLSAIIDQIRTVSGCLQAGIYQNLENENQLLLLERWSTQEDADVHRNSDIFTVLMGAGSLLVQPPEVVMHTAHQMTATEAY